MLAAYDTMRWGTFIVPHQLHRTAIARSSLEHVSGEGGTILQKGEMPCHNAKDGMIHDTLAQYQR